MMVDDTAAVNLLRRMLETRSLSGEEGELAQLLAAWMSAHGFRVQRDEVGNVLGTTEPDASSAGSGIVILGHMDTVPGDVPVECRDGKLYGRGAVDAKGPLAAAIVAAARARGSIPVTVIGAVQEEASSVGARHLTAMAPPRFLVIAEPSGADAVVLGYKGSQRLTVEWTQPCGHTAGAEPTAPERTVDFWNRLQRWCDDVSSGETGSFRRLTPRLIRMSSTSDDLHETACLHIGMRLPPGTTAASVRDSLERLWPEARFTFAPGEDPVLAGKSTPLVAAFLRSMRTTGARPRFKTKTGTSDMNVVGPVWGCPMVAYGPGDSNLDHTPEEHVRVDEYLRGIAVLTGVLEGLE